MVSLRNVGRSVLVVACALGGLYCAPKSPDDASGETASTESGGANLLRSGNRLAVGPSDFFLDKVQPILAEKCVTCHACAESPCQLKLNSFTGIARGASQSNVYDLHIRSVPFTANEDQHDENGWRGLGFSSVRLGSTPILKKALDAGKRNRPGFNASFTQAGIPKWTCPQSPVAYDDFIGRNPHMGMPYGLPSLSPEEYGVLDEWFRMGSPGPSPEAQAALVAPAKKDVIERWERFFEEGDETVGYGTHVDIVSRFIFEHSFLAHLHFEENPGEYYQLVRSRTPPGQPLDEIFTEVPYDPPGIASRVYYRLKKIGKVIARKNHIVWRLNDQKIAFYTELFYRRAGKWWSASTPLPKYEHWNPFENFKAIPAKLRYQWMLDNTSLLIDHMTRGPVCVGSMATYVVADHFWGWFLDPDSDPSVLEPMLGMPDYSALGIRDGRNTLIYLKAYEDTLRRTLARRGKRGLSVADLWDGKKGTPYPSPTAWTTQLRHETNMTVHNGPAGGMPQSIWVSSFSHLERLYYDLVATFKAHGSAAHKVETWQYMSYIRTEGEDLFISLLPEDQRQAVRDEYTSGWIGTLKRYNDYGVLNQAWKDAMVKAGYLNTNMLAEGRPPGEDGPVSPTILASKVLRHLGPQVVPQDGDPLNNFPRPNNGWTVPPVIRDATTFEAGMRTLTATNHWANSRYVPNVVYIRLGGNDSNAALYTLVSHRGYDSHNMEFAEALVRRPEKDTLSVYRGIMGNYPGLFLDLPWEKAGDALRDLQNVKSEETWDRFEATYGISRSSEAFWPFVKWLNAWQERNDVIDGGIVDLSQYGVRVR